MLRTLAIMILLTFGLILNPGDARSANVDSAAIVNSGSTNRPGFRIVVARSGVAEYTATPPRRTPQPQETTGTHHPVDDFPRPDRSPL